MEAKHHLVHLSNLLTLDLFAQIEGNLIDRIFC